MCVHNRILFSCKMKEISSFATTRVYLEGIRVSKIGQTGKDKYYMISNVESKKKMQKKKTNPTTKLIDKENRLMVVRGGGWVI